MKKFAISLIALAAISTASFAANRDEDLVNSGYQLNDDNVPQLTNMSTSSDAFFVARNSTAAPTAAEIMLMNAIENERNNSDK